MKNADSVNECYDAMLRDHVRLRSMLEETKQVLIERSVDISDLHGKLVELNELLVEHFRIEEESGCFSGVISHAPHVSDKVGLLLAEHGEMQVELDRLVEYVAQCEGTPEAWQKIVADFEELNEKLMQHESEENELVQKVFTQDIGDKD